MNQMQRLYIGLGILVLIAGSFIIYQSLPLLFGTTIVLDTQPVDPFDPLRGQYIIIRYVVGQVDTPAGAQVGDAIFVSLREDKDGIWRSTGSSLTPPDGIFIRGEIESIYSDQSNIRFGIEQYYFERNAQFPTANMTVQAKVGGDGRAKIVELLQNGKPVTIAYRNATLSS